MEVSRGDGDLGTFLFGWQCDNPYADELIAATLEQASHIDHVRYSYLEDDPGLPVAISDMHESFGERRPQAIHCGIGAMSLLFSFVAYLKANKVTEVYYLSPIYFAFHSALRLFDIKARPISAFHGFETNFKMNLPEKETILIVSDPIWYASQPFPIDALDEISNWQKRTNSIVFVDGSFQYMSWDKKTFEYSSTLDPERTLRVISPTKSLATSGYRFAYCLLPTSWRAEFNHIYANIYGSANADSIAFGRAAVAEMNRRMLTNKLVDLMAQRHRTFRQQKIIESVLEPKCGFFSFERLLKPLPENYLMMGGEYFDQPRYPGYVRLNLLSPSLHLLNQ
jgi:aspartate/methionine/tyrosine aminotransferase